LSPILNVPQPLENQQLAAGKVIIYIRESRALVPVTQIRPRGPPGYYLDFILIDKIQQTVYTQITY
jgi:hypothetical protein